jgi:hypothetical protein
LNRSDVEYFAALLTTLESCSNDESEVSAVAGLLAMAIKSVPKEVLQAKFGDISKLLSDKLVHFLDGEDQNLIRYAYYALVYLPNSRLTRRMRRHFLMT